MKSSIGLVLLSNLQIRRQDLPQYSSEQGKLAMQLISGINGTLTWLPKQYEIIWRTSGWRLILCARSHTSPGRVWGSRFFGLRSISSGHLSSGKRLSSQTRQKSISLTWMIEGVKNGHVFTLYSAGNNWQSSCQCGSFGSVAKIPAHCLISQLGHDRR